jgi:hypothetical protein
MFGQCVPVRVTKYLLGKKRDELTLRRPDLAGECWGSLFSNTEVSFRAHLTQKLVSERTQAAKLLSSIHRKFAGRYVFDNENAPVEVRDPPAIGSTDRNML